MNKKNIIKFTLDIAMAILFITFLILFESQNH